MNHYFIANESLPVDERELNFVFKNNALTFKTNAGLFSYKEVDYASRLLMENIPTPPAQTSLLDLGCGYGAIGITLAKIYGLNLTMCDINGEALKYAKLNAGINSVHANIILSDGQASVPGKFGTIAFNPPIHAGKDVVFRMYREAAAGLTDGGAL